MTEKNDNKSKLIQISIINDLPRIIKSNVEDSDDKYQETTAKQIETLQDRLTKTQDVKNEIVFWFIFIVFLLLDCVVAQIVSNSIFAIGILLMEMVALMCAANKLGQENALKLLNWCKNIVETLVYKNTKGSSSD